MAGDAMFLEGLDQLRQLHLSKGHDYADAGDPLRNYQTSGDDNNVPAWRAAQLRLSEKYHRLCNLTRGGERVPNHESLDDTLLDLAAMALIVRSLRARERTRLQPARGTMLLTDDGVVHHIVESGLPTSDEHATRWQHVDPGDEA